MSSANGFKRRMAATRLLCGAIAACAGGAAAADASRVTTTEGVLQGLQGDGVLTYLGVPYAAPPVGALRWAPPRAPARYGGTYDATHARAACMQGSSSSPQGSEDCLYLNVYRPVVDGVPVSNAPVMVWIHGGAYAMGAAISYNLAPLAKSQGVVTVSVDYRLGAFGFLSHPALSVEQGGHSGNFGIMDMQAALKWVRVNIKAFGGNPKNVTVFGESAGGNAMFVLLASPSSTGLFDKVVVQSGGYYRNQPSLRLAETRGTATATTTYGCPGSSNDPKAQPPVAACLRALPVGKVLAAQINEPSIDGVVLTETTASAFKNGRFNKVPVMVGSTHDEGTVFASSAPATSQNYASLGTLNMPASQVASLYPLANYGNLPNQALAAAVGDYHMLCGAMQDADSIASYQPRAYVYEWQDDTPASPAAFVSGYPPPTTRLAYGSAHALDITYWLGLILPADATQARVGLSNAMMKHLATFARTGTPNYQGGAYWARYSSSTRRVMHLTYPLSSNYDAHAAHKCAFWYPAPPSESLN